MASEQTKAGSKPKAAKNKRAVVLVRQRTLRQKARDLIEHPTVGWGVITGLIFALIVTGVAIWAREQPLVAVGQVMSRTRTVRVPFSTTDAQATEREREAARQRSPRIYAIDEAALDDVGTSLTNLPASVAGAPTLAEVDERIRERFGLTEEVLASLTTLAENEVALEAWRSRVHRLTEILERRPLMDAPTYQAALQEGLNRRIELHNGSDRSMVVREEAVNIDDAAQLEVAIRRIASVVGFEGTLAEAVTNRLVRSPRATYVFDAEATERAREQAALAVSPVRREYAVGQTIFTRGDVLNESQLTLYRRELKEFHDTASTMRIWTTRLGIGATVIGLTALLGSYFAALCPRISRRAARMSWIAALVGVATAGAAALTVLDPRFVMLIVPGTVALVAVLMRVAYDRTTAGAIAGVCAVLICLATERPVGVLAVCLLGMAMAIGTLAEVRDRREIIRMSVLTAITLGLGSALVGLIDRPMTDISAQAVLRQTLGEGALGTLGGLAVGGITMFALPFVERAFDITTGMTLIELRDPKQPLLREMQQRAPGTYNHSLNVASIAESAAESIGADSLLTYVGCLYHDIGKINKPEYFVENQRGGENRHDKLSPAMSLLVIIGHVKDGVEMAREHDLPPPIVHFIEAHHGTTLVEYFYRRAREKAKPQSDIAEANPAPKGDAKPERDADRLPDEVDYRYPGPRPRTKEVAITMLSDAVESATRTLPEPTPARIEALVRQIAQARLMDGQFDDCDLTLADVRTICDSISKTVSSIYHGRISYSGEQTKKPKPPAAEVEKSA
ncbi:MAG: 7TM receptor with intracellular metal dependent phosphohydrolase [Phycisphaeraceae bacterium]|nr:MAG: 7TM receptor with intracellular metal dependent phosphohydrolase [Phycisphaeraceae bacterium]